MNKKQSPFISFYKKFSKHRLANICLFIVLLEILLAVFLPVILDLDPYSINPVFNQAPSAETSPRHRYDRPRPSFAHNLRRAHISARRLCGNGHKRCHRPTPRPSGRILRRRGRDCYNACGRHIYVFPVDDSYTRYGCHFRPLHSHSHYTHRGAELAAACKACLRPRALGAQNGVCNGG